MEILTVRTEIKLFTLLAFWGIFSIGYFERFPLPGFFVTLFYLGLSLVVALSAYGWGAWLVKRCTLPVLSTSEIILFSTVTGFGTLSLFMVLMGVLKIWNHGASIGLIVAGVCLAWMSRQALLDLFRTETTASKGMKPLPLFIIWTGGVVSLLAAFAPAIYYDTLVYHYALPQAYIQAGHWIGQTQLIYSAFPQVMEMLWTLGMLLSGDILANLLGWIMAALGVWAVYCFAKRYFGSETAAWAAAILSAMPTYLLLSSRGYVDVGLAVFSFTSFYALCLWKEHQKVPWLVLAGILAGCAAGTKYTGAIPLVIGVVIIIHEGHLKNPQRSLYQVFLYSLSALVIFGPWLAKNVHYVGNPFFPFFHTWSLKPLSPWVTEAADGYFRGLTEYTPRSGWGLLKLPWDIAVHGFDFGGGMDVVGNLGWAPLFAFLPALWITKQKSPMLNLLLVYALFFYIPWAMARPVLRFLVPLAPFLALVAAYAYELGICRQKAGFRFAGQLFLTLLLLSNARLYLEVSDVLSLFNVPLGFTTRTEYLTEKLNYFGAASFVNALPKNSLTYIVGDQRGYYYNKPVVVTPVFNTNPLTGWANDSASGHELVGRLKEHGFTHILVNNSEFKRLNAPYHLYPFTTKGQSNWNALRERAATPVYHDEDCDIYAL